MKVAKMTPVLNPKNVKVCKIFGKRQKKFDDFVDKSLKKGRKGSAVGKTRSELRATSKPMVVPSVINMDRFAPSPLNQRIKKILDSYKSSLNTLNIEMIVNKTLQPCHIDDFQAALNDLLVLH